MLPGTCLPARQPARPVSSIRQNLNSSAAEISAWIDLAPFTLGAFLVEDQKQALLSQSKHFSDPASYFAESQQDVLCLALEKLADWWRWQTVLVILTSVVLASTQRSSLVAVTHSQAGNVSQGVTAIKSRWRLDNNNNKVQVVAPSTGHFNTGSSQISFMIGGFQHRQDERALLAQHCMYNVECWSWCCLSPLLTFSDKLELSEGCWQRKGQAGTDWCWAAAE